MAIKDLAIRHKIVLLITLAALLPMLVVAYYANLKSTQALKAQALDSMDFKVQGIATHIQTFLEVGESNALFLADVPALHGLVRARQNNGFDAEAGLTEQAWMDRLNTIYTAFGKTNANFLKVRYIDEQGNEIVRINFKDGKASLAPSAALQNKNDRPYFVETMKLSQGQVYVSPLNLNREEDRVSEPYIPVVRFSVPVFSKAGERQGIVVISMLGQFFLDLIPKEDGVMRGQFIMVDRNGYYLSHQDKTKVFGGDLNRPDNLFKDAGLANLATTPKQHGTLNEFDDQLMAYALIYPNAKDLTDRWIVLNVEQRVNILSSVKSFQRTLYLLVALSLLITMMIGVWLSRTWFVNPLTRILLVLNRFTHGDTAVRFRNPSEDEIGRVGAAFNHMAQLQAESQLREREQLEELREAADIRGRVTTLREHIVRVASGDLTQRLVVTGNDDLSQLGHNINMMTENIASIALGTTEVVSAIQSTLQEMQSAINHQSSGASEQAVAVNETTAALEQIKGMGAQAMERVHLLGATADRSRRESEQGSAAVDETIAGMESILHRMEGIAQTILALSEQIQQIGEITGVVTNLAQQSKMLALNASIEAAKAGEAGKGFAVVAAEVRELAEQSQQSTAQVQKILLDIRHATDRAVMATEEGSKGVDAGMLSVQRSGEVMRQLGEVVRETAVASHQIAAVVKQQFIGLEQVTSAMKDINKVTSQFVINTHQSKAASEEISKVVEQLHESVSIYQL
ncbi:MAG: methyl-accepting chemotaxis protein [Gallionella sp.]|nr:methyl-accepting chemotaxis protein [Gallionella sp.]MDD4958292.1 methyl-accepting chemotaxis protein [Gallionella sp.]